MPQAGLRALSLILATGALFSGGQNLGVAADSEALKPRVPPLQIQEARTWKNPFPSTPESIEKGKKIFHGKAFCVTCHGPEGKGLGLKCQDIVSSKKCHDIIYNADVR